MPSTSRAQHDLMEMVVHGNSDKVPQDVAREYVAADKKEDKKEKKAKPKKKSTRHAKPGKAEKDKHKPLKRGSVFRTKDSPISFRIA